MLLFVFCRGLMFWLSCPLQGWNGNELQYSLGSISPEVLPCAKRSLCLEGLLHCSLLLLPSSPCAQYNRIHAEAACIMLNIIQQRLLNHMLWSDFITLQPTLMTFMFRNSNLIEKKSLYFSYFSVTFLILWELNNLFRFFKCWGFFSICVFQLPSNWFQLSLRFSPMELPIQRHMYLSWSLFLWT